MGCCSKDSDRFIMMKSTSAWVQNKMACFMSDMILLTVQAAGQHCGFSQGRSFHGER